MDYLNLEITFLSSFVIVCLLGLQSQFVRDKQVILSFVTSLGIGLCQVMQFKMIPNADGIAMSVFVLGGACGIVSSIYVHNFLFRGENG